MDLTHRGEIMTTQRYPRSSAAHWYQGVYPGSRMNANTGVIHTTEGVSLPSYGGGASAPTFTVVPNVGARTCSVYQHFDVDRSARALVNAPGGVGTNTLNCVQVELVGTCDPATHTKWGKTPHVFWPQAEDWALMELARLMRWLSDEHGVKLQSTVAWKAYPSSYGTRSQNGVRLTGQQWLDTYGWVGHMHVPENLHGDPGAFPIVRTLDLAKRKAWETPAPAPAPAPSLEQRVAALETRVAALETP